MEDITLKIYKVTFFFNSTAESSEEVIDIVTEALTENLETNEWLNDFKAEVI